MEKKIKVAVIGTGKMGLMHAGVLSVLPNIELVAVCDKSLFVRKFLKKVLYAVKILDDVNKLSGLSLDAAYVTTPIPSHFPVIRSLFSERIAPNIFVEKTLASSFNEAKELCELSRRFDGITMVGYQRHFSSTFRKVKALLEQQTIGELLSFEAYAYSSDFFGSENDSKAHAAKVGALRDLGCHAIDVALWFFGDMQVESVKFEAPNSGSSSVYFECRRRDDLEGKFSISQSMENYRMPEVGLLVNGSLGTIEVDDDRIDLKLKNGKTYTWYRHDLNDNVAFLLGTPEYFREDEHFVGSIICGQTSELNFETAIKVDYLIDQVKEKVVKNMQ